MSTPSSAGKASLERRLLREIREMQSDPYPNIHFRIDDCLTEACLILTPDGGCPLHMRMALVGYPMSPPIVRIQSNIRHPNIYGDYICASILNTKEGYTPAYTIKGIALQLLSFFNSDKIEQDDGGEAVSLDQYKQNYAQALGDFHCQHCGFDENDIRNNIKFPQLGLNCYVKRLPWERPIKPTTNSSTREQGSRNQCSDSMDVDVHDIYPTAAIAKVAALPGEILLQILAEVPSEHLSLMARALPRVKAAIQTYDFIRVRELQCYVLKESFLDVELGIGVAIVIHGREGKFESEFELISRNAVHDCKVHTSVQGRRFQHWLPLPISRRHWRIVRPRLDNILNILGRSANLIDPSPFSVLSHFLSDIVVKFSQEAEKTERDHFDSQHRYVWQPNQPVSTLTHASERAVEGYFALFHLLLCLTTERPSIVATANAMLARFMGGETSKSACPNLGILLVATLISDLGLTPDLMLAAIKEAILRNVVWMLTEKPELSYLEPSAISEYRLKTTFLASRTSYRLLMFCSLFARCARPDPSLPLSILRDNLFDAHGAPPRGMAEHMAKEIRRVKGIDAFPPFLMECGIKDDAMPSKSEFTSFLRRMVVESDRMGYSRTRYSQPQALEVRLRKEPFVEVAEGFVRLSPDKAARVPNMGFFPEKKRGRR